MKLLKEIFDNNKAWSENIKKERPDFFSNLEKQQTPKYLWIGCSDSRVPANQICGLEPGQVFVHRNVANVVTHTDFNCLSVLQYAVEVLKVEHVIVCGHYGCGGVNAALANQSFGLIDNWLRHIKDVLFEYKSELEKITDLKQRQDKLAELNVKAQVYNLCYTTIVQECWKRRQPLSIHGWIYGLQDGRLKDLNLCISSAEQVDQTYLMK